MLVPRGISEVQRKEVLDERRGRGEGAGVGESL